MKFQIGHCINNGRKQSEGHRKKRSIAMKISGGHSQSIITRKKLSIALSGEKSPLWRGGIDSENHKIRAAIEYRLWREAVFARDNYTCQKTGIKGGQLESHHLMNFSDYPELRFALDNGITLSKSSHRKFHIIYSNFHNTKEQMEEFLKAKVK